MPDILHYLRSFRHLIHLPDGDGKLLQRFRLQRDELAFATLVQRHGPMVLGIAQRILGQSDLLDDVFQATFLVLAKRGRQMETWPSVAGWLVQVARRTALQARTKSARRTRHEQQAAAMTPNTKAPEPADIISQRDLSQLLDAELARLPSKYRTPLVLCHLEGQSKEETARQLGWPVGSVSGRLARGKKLLQARLLRHGIVPALATGIFTVPAANAHLPSLLIQATTLLASNVVHQTSQVSASTAVVLAQGVMTSMLMTKVKYAASILLVLGLCLGTGALAWQGKGNETTAPVQVPKNEAKVALLLERLQGAWVLEKLQVGNNVRNRYLNIVFDSWAFRGKEYRCLVNSRDKQELDAYGRWGDSFDLNETTEPCQFTDRLNWRGIIKIQDDVLFVNLVPNSVPYKPQELPKNFEPSDGTIAFTMRRLNDYLRLEGIWRKEEERNPVTDEIDRAEELIFKKNMYVRRIFGKGSSFSEDPPSLFSLNETTSPKQIDLDIRSAAYMKDKFAYVFQNDLNLPRFMKDSIDKNRVLERRLGIYELKDNEFKYLISGGIPFTLVNKEFVLNPQSPINKRATSFQVAEGTVVTYKRVERSLKDSANTKLETPNDTRFKPPTGTPGEMPTTETLPSPQLQDLRQQRLKLAQERLKLWQISETSGSQKASIEELGTISQQIFDASLALVKNRADTLRVWDEHLKMLKQIEDKVSLQVKSGTRNPDDLLAAQLRRIEVEIKIEERKELEKTFETQRKEMEKKH